MKKKKLGRGVERKKGKRGNPGGGGLERSKEKKNRLAPSARVAPPITLKKKKLFRLSLVESHQNSCFLNPPR